MESILSSIIQEIFDLVSTRGYTVQCLNRLTFAVAIKQGLYPTGRSFLPLYWRISLSRSSSAW
jgi:hypothetical protein